MRLNALKRKLAAGQRVRGFSIEFNNPEVLELFGLLGYDFVYIDAQHCGLTIETARNLIRAADLVGVTSLVRVPRNDASVILEYLDAGAGGIVVPNINTRAEVDAAVDAMRYPPVGRRSGFGRSRAAQYGTQEGAREYFTRINDEVLFVPLLEDQAVLAELDTVVSAPGVDIVAIGPSDLAFSMGIVGGWFEPEVQANVERIRAAAAAAGKPAIGVATSADDGRRLYAQGFQCIMTSALALMTDAARGFVAETEGT